MNFLHRRIENFLHKWAAHCYFFMRAKGYSTVGTDITREGKTSEP